MDRLGLDRDLWMKMVDGPPVMWWPEDSVKYRPDDPEGCLNVGQAYNLVDGMGACSRMSAKKIQMIEAEIRRAEGHRQAYLTEHGLLLLNLYAVEAPRPRCDERREEMRLTCLLMVGHDCQHVGQTDESVHHFGRVYTHRMAIGSSTYENVNVVLNLWSAEVNRPLPEALRDGPDQATDRTDQFWSHAPAKDLC